MENIGFFPFCLIYQTKHSKAEILVILKHLELYSALESLIKQTEQQQKCYRIKLSHLSLQLVTFVQDFLLVGHRIADVF